MASPWDGASVAIENLSPIAGAIVILKLLWNFQRGVVEGSMARSAALDERLREAEHRIDELEAEVAHCDLRNAQLVRAMTLAGIEIPPPSTGA